MIERGPRMPDNFVHPDTLHEGDVYYYIEQSCDGSWDPASPVTLLAYDNCPGVVIVCNWDGQKWRCPRERLFVPKLDTVQTLMF